MGLKYYFDMKDAPLSDLLKQADINTEKYFMGLFDSSCQYYLETGRSTRAYIIFIKVFQLTMEHMFQDQFLNQVHKVSTIQNELQEWL